MTSTEYYFYLDEMAVLTFCKINWCLSFGMLGVVGLLALLAQASSLHVKEKSYLISSLNEETLSL